MSRTIPSKPVTPSRSRELAEHILPLQNGDRLTRAEFERRYDATPGLKKAELIEGVVFMPPPVSDAFHASPHFDLIGLLGVYRAATRGIVGGDNGSLRLDMDNEPQPDVYLRILPSHGGQAQMGADGYVEGSPEFVAEIAASSASYDLHQKLNVYRRSGVREYMVWRVLDRALDWFVLREGQYQRLDMVEGIYRSEILPGLWLDPAAMLAGDLATAIQVLHRGIATPEHAAFVTRLRETHEKSLPPK